MSGEFIEIMFCHKPGTVFGQGESYFISIN